MASASPAVAKVDLAALKKGYEDLGAWRAPRQLPLVYHPSYNITLGGLERFHPFDSAKFVKIVRLLQDSGLVKSGQVRRRHCSSAACDLQPDRIDPSSLRHHDDIVRILCTVPVSQLVTPVEATTKQLADVHTAEYLRDLHSSSRRVAKVQILKRCIEEVLRHAWLT